jgi:hypothetical protein
VLESVKLPCTVTPSKKVLHREIKRVKIDGAIIISSKLTNRHKIFNNARCNNNITKIKRMSREKEGKEAYLEEETGTEKPSPMVT